MSFLKKQVEHVEGLKMGRTENHYETKGEGATATFERRQRRADQAKAPPMVVQHAFPVNRKAAIAKPGEE